MRFFLSLSTLVIAACAQDGGGLGLDVIDIRAKSQEACRDRAGQDQTITTPVKDR